MASPYDTEDAAEDTDVSEDEARACWHSARDDRRDEYGLENFKKLWVIRKNLKEEFQKIYQQEFNDVEKEWLKKCRD